MGVKLPVAVYTDGGLIPDPNPAVTPKNPSTIGGTWCYIAIDEDGVECMAEWGGILTPQQRIIWPGIMEHVDVPAVGNNLSELVAAIKALKAMPDGWSGFFCTDSQCTIARIWGIPEGNFWSLDKVPHVYQELLQVHLPRLGRITPVLLDGHPSRAHLEAGVGKRGNPCSIHNVNCDAWCNRVSTCYLTQYIPPPPEGEE